MQKTKIIGAIAGISFLLSLILIFGVSSLQDQIIIASGIRFFKTLLTLGKLLSGASLIGLGYTGFTFYQTQKTQHKAIEDDKRNKLTNPLYDQATTIEKLTAIQKDLESPYKDYAKRILHQMKSAEALQEDFIEIVENNDLPIICDIADELESIQVRLLHDAKSIYRRLIVAEETDVIEKKLADNDKVLKDANSLITEAINYLDVKTPSTDVDLKNLIASLQDLIKLI